MLDYRISRAATLLALTLAGSAAPAHALQIVTEEYPPFNYVENGKLIGLSTEVVIEMGKRANVPMTFTVMPWPQAYDQAQTKADTCIYSTARLENRERIFKWAGKLASNQWGLFAKSDFKDPIKTVADARPYRIGGVENDAKVMWLRDRAVTNIVTVHEDKQIPPMLTLDRKKNGAVDLWITGIYAEKSVSAAAGVKDIKLVLRVGGEELWLACGPTVSNETVKSLSEALAAMNKDGSYKKIAAKYEKKFAP